MKILAKIDEVARRWDQTKNPKYKEEWYKLIREAYYNGSYNLKRRDVSTRHCNKTDDGKYIVSRQDFNKLL